MQPSKIEHVLDKRIKHLHPIIREQLFQQFLSIDKNVNDAVVLIRQQLGISLLPSGTSTTSNKFFEVRGWSKQEAIQKVKEVNTSTRSYENSPYKLSSWLNKGMTIEQAEFEVKKRRILNIEYWEAKGLSKQEAIQKISDFQKEQSIKGNKNHFKGRMPTQIEYWLNRINPITKTFYTNDEAISKVKKRQDVVSYKKYLQRFGYPRGIELKINALKNPTSIDRMAFALYSSTDELQFEENLLNYDKNKKITGHASKESLRFLSPLFVALLDKYEIFIGAYKCKEYKIYHESGFYRYDFTIPELKLIIEYDGYYFHNTKKSKTLDLLKTQVATQLGFSVFRLSSIDSYETNIHKLATIVYDSHIKIEIPKKFYRFKKVFDLQMEKLNDC